MASSSADRLLVAQIRAGNQQAWQDCINLYEGRLTSFAESRLGNRSTAEDVVQETFVGFLTSLPNYDDTTPLESFLFAIAAHKIKDQLRRSGRRPTIPLATSTDDSRDDDPAARNRVASSLARSREQRNTEELFLARIVSDLITGWKASGEFERLKCIELLFVQGWPNKDVASRLGISEQAVANHKHFVVSKLKDAAAAAKIRDFRLADLGIEE